MDFSTEKSLTFLRSAAQALFDENVRLRARIAELEGRAHAADETNTVLAELVARQQHRLFGKSTERKGRGGRPKDDTAPKEPQTGHGPREQQELQRVPVPHELPADKRVCPCCGGNLVPMTGQVERSEIVSVTDKAFVLEVHEQQKYRCGGCNAAVVTAPGPKRLVPGGRYSPYFAIEMAQSQCTNRDNAKTPTRRYDWDRRSTRPTRYHRCAFGTGLDRGKRFRMSRRAPFPPRPRAGRRWTNGDSCRWPSAEA